MNGTVQAAPRHEASYEAVSVADARNAPELWTSVVNASPDAWFWHTWANMQFNFIAAQKYEAQNLSFFLFRNGQIAGAVPLMVNRVQLGDVVAWEASYYGAPLPWPVFLPEIQDIGQLESFTLAELEARARAAGAERIRIRLEPPFPNAREGPRLETTMKQHRYLDSSYVTHWMEVDQNSLAQVRERYRRYVKKFSPAYSMSIADGDGVTSALEESYFHLHVKDAGGQFRSRESYTCQADLARKAEAFFVVARNISSDAIAGMLLISLYKGSAYDNSVAVDPDFQHEYVSHLLKWAAIEELQRRGAKAYELGPRAEGPSLTSLPSEKTRGITYFKEGWARDSVRKIGMAEKFLSARLLRAYLNGQADLLEEYFGLH